MRLRCGAGRTAKGPKNCSAIWLIEAHGPGPHRAHRRRGRTTAKREAAPGLVMARRRLAMQRSARSRLQWVLARAGERRRRPRLQPSERIPGRGSSPAHEFSHAGGPAVRTTSGSSGQVGRHTNRVAARKRAARPLAPERAGPRSAPRRSWWGRMPTRACPKLLSAATRLGPDAERRYRSRPPHIIKLTVLHCLRRLTRRPSEPPRTSRTISATSSPAYPVYLDSDQGAIAAARPEALPLRRIWLTVVARHCRLAGPVSKQGDQTRRSCDAQDRRRGIERNWRPPGLARSRVLSSSARPTG